MHFGLFQKNLTSNFCIFSSTVGCFLTFVCVPSNTINPEEMRKESHSSDFRDLIRDDVLGQSLITTEYDRDVRSSAHTVIQDQWLCPHSRWQNETWFTKGRVSCQHLGLHQVQILPFWLLPHFQGLFHCAGKVDALSICRVCIQKK